MKHQYFFRLALALFSMGASQASLAQGEIYVTNSNSVTVYARTVSGNIAPVRVLTGAATGLANPSGLAVDEVNNELFVVNRVPPESITVYPRAANGNVAPIRIVTGPLTLLADPRGLSLDLVNNELAVVNRSGAVVRVFRRTATGNEAPLRSLVGAATGLSNPTDVAIDTVNNELVVANNGGSLTTYVRAASGNTAPVRVISGASTGFNNGPIGVGLDLVNNEVAVTNPSFGPSFLPSILVFARTPGGNVAPLRAIVGAATITEGTATAAAPTFSANDVVVGVTNVINQQYVTVSLTSVSSVDGGTGGSGSVRIGFLLGDVNQNRVVAVSDLGLVNAQLAQAVGAANYLKDVNATGTLTVADKGIANANLAKALPAP